MKLDLDLLVMRLILEQEGTVLPQASCNEYLISQVLLPLLRGEPVPLRAIDYGAFDEDDISALAEYNDAVYRIAQAFGADGGAHRRHRACRSLCPAIC